MTTPNPDPIPHPEAEAMADPLMRFIDSAPVEQILRQMCFEFISLARLWRESGTEIEHRAEAEQAFFLRRMLRSAALCGDDWRKDFASEIQERIAKVRALSSPETP